VLTHLLRLLLAHRIRPFLFSSAPQPAPEINLRKLGLYLHVPFCRSLCDFCPYFKVLYQRPAAEAFAGALSREAELVSQLSPSKLTIHSIYLGGGTPALLLKQLPRMLGTLKRSFHVAGPLAIELHPADLEQEPLQRLRDLGFELISVGVQSFQPRMLANLGRQAHDGDDSRDRLARAAQAGFNTMDVDLIFGIPGQRPEDLARDFRTALDCGATQVSAYPFIDFSYAKVERKPLGRREKKRLLEVLAGLGRELGLERTSIWTFARPGSARYSSVTRESFLGLGPSAATLLRDRFSVNTFSVPAYIDALRQDRLATALTLRFTPRTRALYWLFWAFYGLSARAEEFRELFGGSVEEEFGGALRAGRALGLVVEEPDGWRLTPRGAYLFHLVEQHYTHRYIDKTWRLAQSEPWPRRIALY
jgi:coproporphyrinogen III oxidase-like Fe-S oxidoreductase